MEDDCRFLLLVLFFSTLLASETVVHAQSSDGFINIACGKPKDYTYSDAVETLGLTYTSDDQYIDSGEIGRIAPNYLSSGEYPKIVEDLRSFPNGSRNCYSLKPVKRGGKYLVRAYFMYGNYDGLNRFPKFDLHVGVNFWDQISSSNASVYLSSEIMTVATSDFLSLCLVNTDDGTPFVSAIEVRPLSDDFYSVLSSSQAFRHFYGGDPGGDADYRFPSDFYDRIWVSLTFPNWRTINATSVSATETAYQPPSEVMRTASTPISDPYFAFAWGSTKDASIPTPTMFFIALHFAELEPLSTSQSRVFDIYINDKLWHTNVKPLYLKTTTVSSSCPENYDMIEVNISKTGGSTLPPIINAIEVYRVLDFSTLETDGGDVAAMLEIKGLYKLKKNWMGDPCAPTDFIWDGLKCSYTDLSKPRIISLNLSSSGLTGEIPSSLSNLTQLQYLDLSNNKLTGGIPSSLASLANLTLIDLMGNNLSGVIPREIYDRIRAGILTLKIENPQFPDEKHEKKWKIIVAAVVGSIALVLIVVGAALLFFRRRNGVRNNDSERVQQPKDDDQNIKKPEEVSINSGSRQFSYNDLVKITRNFTTVIGEGGFGLVYLGVLDGGTQVAVKVLSKASSQGQKQFHNEAVLLSQIHHRNLVSLFGYCSDPNCMSLVYEYMEEGSIHDHLSGKTSSTKPFGWKQRLEIAIGAAQGLEYLHDGCKSAIVHRDIKTQNILLDRNMEAKIGDFGLSKIFQSDIQSYVTTMVLGTPGYLDPEYSCTQKLNEKSDVYSFGVVLLQLVTGLPAIIRGNVNDHIVEFVLPRYEKGAIEEIVDRRFDGNYSINSICKAMDIALASTSRSPKERPTMGQVLAQLKGCLSLEGNHGMYQSSSQQSHYPKNQISVEMTPTTEEMFFNPQAR